MKNHSRFNHLYQLPILGRVAIPFVLLALLVISRPALCDPIHDAVKKGDLETVKALVAKNPGLVYSKNGAGETPLHLAAEGRRVDVAEFLLANKADVNAKGVEGYTPLHWAAAKDYKDFAELLLANKADVNAKAFMGITPLHLAATGCHEDLVELLLTNGADVNAKIRVTGATPWQWAKHCKDKDLAELLRPHRGH